MLKNNETRRRMISKDVSGFYIINFSTNFDSDGRS